MGLHAPAEAAGLGMSYSRDRAQRPHNRQCRSSRHRFCALLASPAILAGNGSARFRRSRPMPLVRHPCVPSVSVTKSPSWWTSRFAANSAVKRSPLGINRPSVFAGRVSGSYCPNRLEPNGRNPLWQQRNSHNQTTQFGTPNHGRVTGMYDARGAG